MKLLGRFAMLLFLCVAAETNTVWREAGNNVTLRCSSCSEGYDGMYLFLYQQQNPRKQVLYYPKTPGDTFMNRTVTEGSLRNHTVTISQLTVDDAGFYKCVYIKFPRVETQCSNYTLFVRGVAPCCCPLAEDKSPCLAWIIIAAFTTGMLVTIPFILLVAWRVRRRCGSSRRTSVPRQVPNDNVYEVMTPAQEAPPPGPQCCA
ncbi:uncharacterized protein LOC119218343 [Pungitius pungitius]|uniref:uncharacterized protein LOC119218343 n=1 Tax=Pungitius pungitius TaxID=134920 RepID=UPI002E11145C